MSFTSYEFILAVAAVFVLYYTIPKRFQWMFLLGASYVLYFTANPFYLIFISVTTAVTFFVARKISSLSQEKTAYLKENKATLDREAKKAYKDNISLKEACVELGFLTAERFDEVFHPEEMV